MIKINFFKWNTSNIAIIIVLLRTTRLVPIRHIYSMLFLRNKFFWRCWICNFLVKYVYRKILNVRVVLKIHNFFVDIILLWSANTVESPKTSFSIISVCKKLTIPIYTNFHTRKVQNTYFHCQKNFFCLNYLRLVGEFRNHG